MNKQPVYIVSAVRTPIGSLNGALSSVSAVELGARVIVEGLKRAGIKGNEVNEVILGQVFTAAQGQNPARQASMKAGIPQETPAWGLNMLCGSGLKSVVLGYQSILCGDASVVVCGGQESMSQTPHVIHLRNAVKLGNASMMDTLLKDGLQDAFHNCHMGITAENIVKKYNISRSDQDNFALNSQLKTDNAVNSGFFHNEIIPISVPSKNDSKQINQDEHPRPSTTLESLSKLKSCFILGSEGTVTAGNASGINDGAAVVVLVNEEVAKRKGTTCLAQIISWAQAGVDPDIMGMGPVPAVRAALKKANWSLEDVDLFEINEAFAAQSLAVIKELGIDKSKININGGAIALGHPLGASGARILVTLVHALRRTGRKKGLAALCIGGGMGIAICIQTV